MGSGFMGLDIALRSLLAHQQAIEVVSHNIANVNTPGYSRQKAVLRTDGAAFGLGSLRGSAAGLVGGGVSMHAVRRMADNVLANHIRMETHVEGEWTVIQNTLHEIEAILGEPAEGSLSGALDAFWSSWRDLSADATNSAVRTSVLEAGRYLAGFLNSASTKLHATTENLNSQIRQYVQDINDLAREVAYLNVEIAHVQGVGDSPNDLCDRRDLLLEQLAELVDIDVTHDIDGSVSVLLGGHHLVTRGHHADLQAEPSETNPELLVLSWVGHDGAVRVSSGRLAGALRSRDEYVASIQAKLDEITRVLVNAVNDLHRQGFDLQGNAGIDFFTGDLAHSIQVNDALVSPDQVAAAAASSDDPDQSAGPGDGSIALRLADLSSALLMDDGTATIGTTYRGMIGQLGMNTRHASMMLESSHEFLDHLQQRRDSVSGVSLDEETIDLVQYQRAYQAAARMITLIDEMLDRLINGTGIVGR
ncbi:MAG TPA: flagellar hook-associated protein FlgK [Chloroflexi bacterium]|jgi:flagellar hook-associated protein 1 FlgK|nr:flagellar hook-associated protein FlgK [Chloroflexota bacterium]